MSENIEIRTKDEVQEGKPELVARLFCSMDDGQQAEFFSWCAAIEKEWQAEWKRVVRKAFLNPEVSGLALEINWQSEASVMMVVPW